MGAGDLSYARFPITLDLDAVADIEPQVGISNSLFLLADFDVILSEIIPMTGTGGKSKGVVVMIGREV